VGTVTLLSLGLGFDKPRSRVLVLLHSGREEVSLGVSMGCWRDWGEVEGELGRRELDGWRIE
jgi:hypothetical protein